MISRTKLVVVILIVAIGLVACGGGGGGGGTTSTTTPVGTAVNLSQIKSFLEATASPGSAAVFPVTGSASNGDNITGTFSFTVTGATTTTTPSGTQTVNIVQQYTSLTDTKTNGTLSGIATYYLYQSGHIYKVLDNDGVTATPISQTLLPASAKVGDFGNDMTLSYSDGTTEVSTWRLDPGTNGDAIIVYIFTTTNSSNQLVSTEEDHYTIKSDGSIKALSAKYFDAGSSISISVSGNRS